MSVIESLLVRERDSEGKIHIQLGKPAHHELKNGKTNEKPQIPFHRQR